MLRRTLLAICVGMLLVPSAWSADAWVLRFQSVPGKRVGCRQAIWSTDTLFFNKNPFPVVLRLVDVSNGSVAPGTDPLLTLPGGQVVTLESSGREWFPNSGQQPWVLHLDLPDGVVVESRNEVEDDENCTPEHAGSKGTVAKVSLPVIRNLTPANDRQVILGTDLVSPGSRQNVTIFNAGETEASAVIEVRRGCDDRLLDSRTVTIPRHSVQQFGGLSAGKDLDFCAVPARTYEYVRYVTVKVDQPSFALVSTLKESDPVTPDGVTPLVELALTFSSPF